MKKQIFFILTMCLIVFVAACKKDDGSGSAPASEILSEAKPEFDTTNFGIYKAIFVGENGRNGAILFKINNDSTGLSATLKYNDSLETAVAYPITVNLKDTSYINFSSKDYNFQLILYWDDNLETVKCDLYFYGNNSSETFYTSVFKEYSTLPVSAFIGNFTGDDSGIFNSLSLGNFLLEGYSYSINSGNDYFVCEFSNNTNFSGSSLISPININGARTNNAINGNWTSADSTSSGTFAGLKAF